MTLTELDLQLRAIADELAAIDRATPEMSGTDLAFDRGNITYEEWQAAGEASKLGVKRQEEQVQRIEQLRQEHSERMTEYLAGLLGRLVELQRAVDAQLAGVPDQQDRTLRFNRTLLPDLVECLTAWRDRTPSKTWQPWAWRIVFRIADETTAALDRTRR
jgi:hypothetical protein